MKNVGEYQGMVGPMEDKIRELLLEFSDSDLGILPDILNANGGVKPCEEWKS